MTLGINGIGKQLYNGSNGLYKEFDFDFDFFLLSFGVLFSLRSLISWWAENYCKNLAVRGWKGRTFFFQKDGLYNPARLHPLMDMKKYILKTIYSNNPGAPRSKLGHTKLAIAILLSHGASTDLQWEDRCLCTCPKKLPPEFSMILNTSRQQACQNRTATWKHWVVLKNLQLQVVPKLWTSTAEDLYHHCQRLDRSHRRCTSHKTPFKVVW